MPITPTNLATAKAAEAQATPTVDAAEDDDLDINPIITISAPKAVKEGKKPEGWSIDVDTRMPADLKGCVARWTEDTVYRIIVSQVKVRFATPIRTMAENGVSDEDILNRMATWDIGQKLNMSFQSKASIAATFANMSKEEQDKLLAELKAMSGV